MIIVYSAAAILILCIVIAVFSGEWFRHLAEQLQLYVLIAALLSGMWWLGSSVLSPLETKPGASELINLLNHWAASAAVISASLGLGIYLGNTLSKLIEKRQEERNRTRDEAIAAAIEERRSDADTL